MRKANTVTVIYTDNNILHNITVNYKGDFINLYHASEQTPVKFNAFQQLYKCVLDILKNNGFYVDYWTQYEQKFYNIQFINTNDPVNIHKYAYIMEV